MRFVSSVLFAAIVIGLSGAAYAQDCKSGQCQLRQPVKAAVTVTVAVASDVVRVSVRPVRRTLRALRSVTTKRIARRQSCRCAR